MDNDPKHAAIWTAVGYIRDDVKDLRADVRGSARRTQLAVVLPWAAWFVLAMASTCTGRPMPAVPGLPQAQAAQAK